MSKYTRLNKINHYHDSGSMLPVINYSDRARSPSIDSQMSKHSPRSKPTFREPLTKIGAKPHNRRANKALTSLLSAKSSKALGYNQKLAIFAIFSILLVVLVCIGGIHSLNCYHCSSVDNPSCDETFTGGPNITDTDCEKQIGRPAKVCRKIVQYIEHKKVVIRSCGYIDEHDEKDRKPICYKRSGTFAIMMESCNCYTDNCNHSASLVPNQSVLILSICSVLVYYISYYSSLLLKQRRPI